MAITATSSVDLTLSPRESTPTYMTKDICYNIYVAAVAK